MEYVAIDTPVQVSGDELEEILETDLPVLLLIWNGDTLRNDVKAELDKAAKDHAGRILVIKADVSKNPDVAERFELGKHPLAIAWYNGEVLMRRPRPWNTDIQAMVEELIKLAPELEVSADDSALVNQPTQEVIFSKPVHVTEETFQREVIESPLPVLVDFWAEWCGPCKMIGPILDKLAGDFAGQIKIAKVDVDANPRLSQAFQIQSIPNLMFVKSGKIVGQQAGALPEHVLRDIIGQLIALEV
jgi:thioredoxin 1